MNTLNTALFASLASASLALAARPGDQQKLAATHPSYTLEDITPGSFFPIGAMDFKGNDLYMSTWTEVTRVFVLKNAAGPKSGHTLSEFATGLAETLGMKIVNGNIYIMQKEELTQLIDSDNDGKVDEYKAIAYDFTKSTMEKEYAVGLAWDGTHFYSTFGDPTMGSGTAVDPIPAGRHNGVLQFALDGTVKPYAGGLRVPGGIEYVYGELWAQDIQGGFRPTNPLFNVRQGRWFGRPVNPPSVFQPMAFTAFPDNGPNQPRYDRAAVDMVFAASGDQRWAPSGRAPGNPMEIKSGPYQGQILIPDCDGGYGGITRVSMERIGTEYQGANYHFSGAAPFHAAGIYKLVTGPDGAIYCGGNGSNNAGWGRTTHIGLDRMILKPGVVPFDIYAVRSKGPNTMEIEFTKPVAASFGANIGSHIDGRKWYSRYQTNYGAGFQQGAANLTIQSANLDASRKKATIQIGGLQEGYMIYLHVADALTAEGGEKLWGTEAWYSLNKFGPGVDAEPKPVHVQADEKPSVKPGANPFAVARGANDELNVAIRLLPGQSYTAQLLGLDGRVFASEGGVSGAKDLVRLSAPSGIYIVSLKAGSRTYSQMISK